MSRGYKWLFVDYTILVLSPSLLLCLHLGMSLFTEQRCFFKYFSVSRPLSSGAVAVSLAVPPLPQPPVLLPPGWRHSPPSLLLLPLPHLPHSLWLLSRLWPQSPGHSLKTIIPPGTRPRLHTGISPYTTVLYKGLAYTQYTHFLWVVLCVWLCTNTTEWLSHTFTLTPFFTGVFSWSYCLGWRSLCQGSKGRLQVN